RADLLAELLFLFGVGQFHRFLPLFPRLIIREALALADQLLQERRRFPVEPVTLVEALDVLQHALEADRIRIEHRPAAPGRKTVTRDIHNVDIAGPQGDALLQQHGALVDRAVDAALDDFLIADVAALDALFL